MTHLIAALFFTLALLAAAVSIHMTVRFYWTEILLALKGEWEGVAAVRPTARPQAARTFAAQPKRAF